MRRRLREARATCELLREFKSLLDDGALSEAEFAAQKQYILGSPLGCSSSSRNRGAAASAVEISERSKLIIHPPPPTKTYSVRNETVLYTKTLE